MGLFVFGGILELATLTTAEVIDSRDIAKRVDRDSYVSMIGEDLTARLEVFAKKIGIERLPSEEGNCCRLMKLYTDEINLMTRAAIEIPKELSKWEQMVECLLDARCCLFADLESTDQWFFASFDMMRDKRFGMSCRGVGVVYIIDVLSGIKVGMTNNISRRMATLKCSAKSFGIGLDKIAFTAHHGNYEENEKIVHNILSKYRTKGSEHFSISMSDALDEIGTLDLANPDHPNFLKEMRMAHDIQCGFIALDINKSEKVAGRL